MITITKDSIIVESFYEEQFWRDRHWIIKLPKPIFEQWLIDLETEYYPQGHSLLIGKNSSEFCCLGVLAMRQGWINLSFRNSIPSKLELDSELMDNANVEECYYLPITLQKFLSFLNDVKLWNFKEIANWLREHVTPGGEKSMIETIDEV